VLAEYNLANVLGEGTGAGQKLMQEENWKIMIVCEDKVFTNRNPKQNWQRNFLAAPTGHLS
jgi:hypothetical protein